jgi:hypothetical protein
MSRPKCPVIDGLRVVIAGHGEFLAALARRRQSPGNLSEVRIAPLQARSFGDIS